MLQETTYFLTTEVSAGCWPEVLLLRTAEILILVGMMPYFWKNWREKLIMWVARRLEKMYLQGEPVLGLMAEHFFQRFGHFIGNGLCYEVATAVMLALKGHRKTRLVWADVDFTEVRKDELREMRQMGVEFAEEAAESGSSGEGEGTKRSGKLEHEDFGAYDRLDWMRKAAATAQAKEHQIDGHAWVEVKLLGIWWAYDFAWQATGIVMPEWLYARKAHAVQRKRFSYEEFWSYMASEDFYAKMLKPESSYLLPGLHLLYRRRTAQEGRDPFQFTTKEDVSWIEKYAETAGQGYRAMDIYVFSGYGGREAPLTPRVMREFLARPERERPKQKSVRQARIWWRRCLRELEARK